jgi:DNA damage-binding protein 1
LGLQKENTDTLFFTTDRRKFAAITFDTPDIALDPANAGTAKGVFGFRTIANGDLADRLGKPVDRGQLCSVDPLGRCIAFQFYRGLICIVPTAARVGEADSSAADSAGESTVGTFSQPAFSVRIDEEDVRDIVFLHPRTPSAPPALAVLFEDEESHRVRIRTYVVQLPQRTLQEGIWQEPDAAPASGGRSARTTPLALDPSAAFLVPLPAAAVGRLPSGPAGAGHIASAADLYAPVVAVGAESATLVGAEAGGSGSSAVLSVQDTVRWPALLTLRTFCAVPTQAAADGGAKRDAQNRRLTEFLLFDARGAVFRLNVACGGGGGAAPVFSQSFHFMGTVPLPTCATMLSAQSLLVGSSFGDSELLRLPAEPFVIRDPAEAATKRMESLRCFPSLGPVVDMATIDLDRQGQCNLVTASGAYGQGSLRVVRAGVGVQESAVVELPGVLGMWSLVAAPNADDPMGATQSVPSLVHQRLLVVSFADDTRIFSVSGEELEEVETDGIAGASKTVLCCDAPGGWVVQVTPEEVRVSTSADVVLKQAWSPASNTAVLSGLAASAGAFGSGSVLRITLAAASADGHIVLALGGGVLVFGRIDAARGTFVPLATKAFPNEISAVAVHTGPATAESGSGRAAAGALVAVSFWKTLKTAVLAAPSLETVCEGSVGGEFQARSLLLLPMTKGAAACLFVGTSDGFVSHAKLVQRGAAFSLEDQRCMAVGTTPVVLSRIVHPADGRIYVFAACDRPAVLYSPGAGIVASNVHWNPTVCVVPFSSPSFPGCLAFASAGANASGTGTIEGVGDAEGSLVIGQIDSTQRLHIQSYPLGVQPRRIVHDKASRCVVVATEHAQMAPRSDVPASNDFVDVSSLRAYDDSTFSAVVEPFHMEHQHVITALATMTVGASEQPYIVVGTSLLESDKEEPQKGQLLLLRVRKAAGSIATRAFELVVRADVGPVLSLAQLSEGRIAAGIGSKIEVFTLKGDATAPMQLKSICSYMAFTMALYLESAGGDFLLVGDLMRSICVLKFHPPVEANWEKKSAPAFLEEIASDAACNYMTSIASLDDCTYIGAEDNRNIFLCTRNAAAVTEDERSLLALRGEFHVGEFINRIVRGSLVIQGQNNDQQTPVPRLIFGTVAGSIGVIASLPENTYRMLSRLQKSMGLAIPTLGGLSQREYREFYSTRRAQALLPLGADEPPLRGFVDGDFVEMFFDLQREIQVQVVALMNSNAMGTQSTAFTLHDVLQVLGELQRLH